MQSTRGGWVDSQLHQQHRVLFGRPTCNDRPSKIYAWTMLKRSLTLLHLAGRIYSSTSSVLPQPLPSPPPPPTRSEGSWLAGQPEALELKLTLSERWPVPFLLPSLLVSLAGYFCRFTPPPVLPRCFGHTPSRCRLSGDHCHSISTTRAVIHQPGGNVGSQPIRCPDSQTPANHRHALTLSDRQRG